MKQIVGCSKIFLILTLLAQMVFAIEQRVFSQDRKQRSFVKIQIMRDENNVENDRLFYYWCDEQISCGVIGKSEGYTRREIHSKYEKLKSSGFKKFLGAGAAGTIAVIGAGVLAFSAFVGGAPVIGIAIVAASVGGSYMGMKINPKWDPFLADKRKSVLSPDILQTQEYLTKMNILEFKENLTYVLSN